MENILYNISQVLGITIIHSLWQGILIYFMLRLILIFAGQLSSSKKYLLAVTSLFAITGWFVYTLVYEIHIYNWLAVMPSKLSATPLMLELPAGISRFNEQSIRYYYDIEEYLPYITIIYLIGLLFNTARLVLGRIKINTIRQTMSIDISLQRQVNKLAEMLNIDQKVRVGMSKLVDVPCMTGFLKPLILLPFTLTTYMAADEIEAILLHELTHIKRNDYLVNLLQQVISALLFFNPCAQLINRIINEERENCCDDLVIKSTPNPVIYAKALLKLEQTRENNMRMVMAATGKKYQLLNRIERIMKTKKTTQSVRPALAAMLILTICIGCIALLNPEIAQGKISIKAITPVISSMLADTSHRTAANKLAHVSHTAKKANHAILHRGGNLYSAAEADRKMAALNEEVQKHSEALNKYYNSGEFKMTQRELEEKAKMMQDFYNRPELKNLQDEMAKVSGSFSKNYGNNDKLTKLSAQMGEKGKNIGAYFNTPEFKKMNEALENKYGIPHHREYNHFNYNDENYKKYQDELDRKLPPEIKRQTEELKTMGEQMSARYETPEFKEQNLRMQALGDSLNKAFNNPALKEQQISLEKLSKQMANFQNNPQLRREYELLQQSIGKMTNYMNSPQYRKFLNDSKKNFNYNYNFNFNDDNEKPEKPEQPEKPEKPESDN